MKVLEVVELENCLAFYYVLKSIDFPQLSVPKIVLNEKLDRQDCLYMFFFFKKINFELDVGIAFREFLFSFFVFVF